jgi:hypothetical protein
MAAAEDEMYRDMATLCPIVVEGSAFLVAVFPARFKSEILPVLSERLPEIQKIFKDKRDNVRRKLGKLENLPQTMLNPTLFECIGRFLRGLMGLE